MANNPYVNKVQKADGTTIIDISDTTATAAQIMQGYGAYGADGAWMDGTATAGSSGVVYITDEIDEHGGIIRNIDTDDATITDTVDTHGGTVRSITGAEVFLQAKSVTPTETAQRITPSDDYKALGVVNVGAIPSDYIGSAIQQRTAADLTVSGATVTAPAGVYGSAASKTISSGSATTPTTSITANPSISVSSSGLITATASASQSITPTVSAGYVSSGTAGTVSVSGSNTSQLTTQAAATITPSTSQQTAVAAGRYTTGAVTVNPIPSQYIVPSGTKTITQNGTGIDVTSYAAVDVAVSGGSSTLITKNITANGTYNASSDNADGYSSVTVNVSGGASNIIQGEFTAGTAGSVQTISLPYTGSGYITALFIYVKGGIYDVNNADNPTWHNLAHQYAAAQWFMTKASAQTAPNYTANNYLNNGCSYVHVYKSTSATAYTRSIDASSVLYLNNTNPSANSNTVLYIPSATQLKIYVSSGPGNYGFVSGIKYSYLVMYSE